MRLIYWFKVRIGVVWCLVFGGWWVVFCICCFGVVWCGGVIRSRLEYFFGTGIRLLSSYMVIFLYRVVQPASFFTQRRQLQDHLNTPHHSKAPNVSVRIWISKI